MITELCYTADRHTNTKGIVRHGSYRASLAAEVQKGTSTEQKTESPQAEAPKVLVAEDVASLDTNPTVGEVKEAAIALDLVTSMESVGQDSDEESEADPNDKLLCLDFRFIEVDPTQHAFALDTYNQARQEASSSGNPLQINAAMLAGTMLNQIQKGHAPIGIQLVAVMLNATLRVSLHEDWKLLGEDHLKPQQAVQAILKADYLRTTTFGTAPWEGKTWSIAHIRDMRTKGGKLWIMPAFMGVISYRKAIIARIEQKRAMGIPCDRDEAALTRNFSEYWAVKQVVTMMTDYTDPCCSTSPFQAAFQESPPDMPVWTLAIELAQLNEVQIRKCKVARDWLRSKSNSLKQSNARLKAACAELLVFPTGDAKTEMTILDLIEKMRINELDRRQIITEAGNVFLFKILSPFQAAMFYGVIQTRSLDLISHYMDWGVMSLIHTFLTCKNNSLWMDTYITDR